MQVALIPPSNYLTFTTDRPMQMILPARLKEAHYRNTYKPERLRDSFVILDNGMFEDDMMSNENLIELTDRWRPDELVMPDMRGDMPGTFVAIDRFLNMFEQVKLDKEPSLMAVIQISNRNQIDTFIKRVMEIYYIDHGMSKHLTIGIPRRLVEQFGPHIRRMIVDVLDDLAQGHAVHLLGYARNGDHPDAFNEVYSLRNRVRSIDTDAPFVWAANNADMRMDPTPYERPVDYDGLTQLDHGLIRTNIKTLDGWARGA